MASILALKRRIQAAQNVSKTTKAMQMIAASKLKRAQQATFASRPYLEKLTELAQNLTTKVNKKEVHPYMQVRNTTGKTLLIALAPDKGLCGGLITNLIREFISYQDSNANTEYIVVGKKLESQVVHLSNEVVASFNFGTSLPTFDMVYPIKKIIDDYYLSRKVDSVKILSTKFNSIFTQTPEVTTILPLAIESTVEKKDEEYVLLEPNANDILPSLLTHYVEMSIYQHLLENFLSEQSSRMMAMQNATTNANDIIEDLTLEYNKTRQAKITSEILDISSAAAALNA